MSEERSMNSLTIFCESQLHLLAWLAWSIESFIVAALVRRKWNYAGNKLLPTKHKMQLVLAPRNKEMLIVLIAARNEIFRQR
jgi:hypothetical protein